MRALPASVLVALAASASLPASAAACSCAPIEPRDRLAAGDPAFTGRVISRHKNDPKPRVNGDETFTYVFRVGHSYNRRHRKRLTLTAGYESAACGVLFRKGERVGAFVYRDGGKLTTNLCSIVDPDELIAAGRQSLRTGQERVKQMDARQAGDGRAGRCRMDGSTRRSSRN